jgi:tRNA dimethylallyltransferase
MGLHAWFLVGPTAVGKSAVAHVLAERLQATIISADSMLVYRGMDVGTAKPTAMERGSVPYWGIDCVTPDQPFSVGDYLRTLHRQCDQLPAPPDRVMVVGGTGLYVDCLLRGLTSRPAPDLAERARLDALQAHGGLAALHHELEQRAPGRLSELADPHNPRRVIRAIELAGQGVLSKAMLERGPARPRLMGLSMASAELGRCIEERVCGMYKQGLLAEAEALRAQFDQLSETARQAIGYAEAWAVLDGRMTQAEAIIITARRTRQLAKRQMTWFRHQAEMHWVEINAATSVTDRARLIQAQWELHGTNALQL